MSVVVNFESFPIRKCTVKTTPAMPIQSILEEACKSFGFPPNGYVLMHKKQELQPSLNLRLANIPTGSSLTLIFKVSTVTIGLQLPTNQRLIEKVGSDWSLWKILNHFESVGSLNLTKVENDGFYQMPVVVFMNREYTTIEVLKSSTPMALGMGDSAGVRFALKPTELKMSDVMHLLEDNPTDVVNDSKPKIEPPPKEQIPKPSPVLKEVQPALAKVETPQPKTEIPIDTNIDLSLKVYLPPPADTGYTQIELPASFYKLSSSELKSILDSQKSKLEHLENRPLMTSKMREEQEKLEQQKHPKTMIRVRFPDRMTVEFVFYSGRPVSALFKEVEKLLAEPKLPFRLYITPPKQDLDSSLTFWKQGLAPASLVYFQSEQTSPYLNQQTLDLAIPFPIPQQESVPMQIDDDEEAEEVREQAPAQNRPPTQPAENEGSRTKSKVPKWLKL